MNLEQQVQQAERKAYSAQSQEQYLIALERIQELKMDFEKQFGVPYALYREHPLEPRRTLLSYVRAGIIRLASWDINA